MIREPYAVGDSVIHGIDPRFRVAMAGAFSVVTAVANGFPTLAAALCIAVVLAAAAKLFTPSFIRHVAAVMGLALLVWAVLPFTFEGDPAFTIGPLTASKQGLALCARISLKTIAIVAAFTALAATMPVSALGRALHRLGVPEKLVFLLLITYRYVFVLEQEYARLRRAAAIRGFWPGTNLHSYRTFAYLIGMLLIRAQQRSERVHKAMKCRGFNGRFHSLDGFSSGRGSRVFLFLMSAAVLGMVLAELLL